jgi:hypothetical protein
MTKKTMAVLLLVLISSAGYAQQKPKPKEKHPTQKEIDEMMREAQEEMDNMSAEDKKMLDSMGFEMPDLGSLPTFTDQQYQDALSEGEFTIPKKDMARVSSVRLKPMSSRELNLYIKSTLAKIEQRMAAQRSGLCLEQDKNGWMVRQLAEQSPILETTITLDRLVRRSYESMLSYYEKVSPQFN